MSVSYGALKDFSFGEDHAPARHSVTVGGSIAQKQNELRDATEARIRALEARGRKAEQDLSQERASLKALTADFEYSTSSKSAMTNSRSSERSHGDRMQPYKVACRRVTQTSLCNRRANTLIKSPRTPNHKNNMSQ
ncbi:hypothetical protein DIPPA_15250 [Diplonema papillatum]|nr:hypothetical protein DIPPA_15250 [Diplonema papillatum]